VLFGVIRWAGLTAFAALAGALALDLLLLPREDALAPARRRLGRWIDAAVVALLVTSGGELLARAAVMAGAPAGRELAVGLSATPAVLAHTHFGMVLIVRAIALLAILILGRLRLRGASLPLALLVAATTALAGHAADNGDWSAASANDWVHVAAGGTWTGGLMALALLLHREAPGWPPGTLTAVCRRFSRLAAWCLAAVVATGVWNAWTQLPDVSALWTTGYGRALGVKLALVALLAAYGAGNRFLVLPRLHADDEAGPGAELRRYVGRETLLALGVFAATAVLTDSTPPRHAGHTEHMAMDQDDASAPAHMSMDALHEAGGVPEGWRFTPPAGDAARGRVVFERLRCYVCHRVAGERFPAPTGPGPDLSGMGHHHPPGYLLESVLNPNAVVVEGRGYTDARGRSAMPELARDITVAELLDLVAYLRTL
jgi:putative copper export protein/mono/diheme cytochrome c family protein